MWYVVRPLTGEARARMSGDSSHRSPFSSTWSSTLDVMRREVEAIVVMRREAGELVYTKPVLMVDVAESQLRLDGGMRADARPASPAVALSVESKHGPLLFATDRFRNWQDNVRAIALGLEALRKVERYGIVQSDEQYRGWQALPPGTPMPAAKMTVEDAARLLCDATMGTIGESWEDIVRTRVGVNDLYREAVKLHHPDRGGDAAMFARLTEARELLLDRSTP